MFVKISTERSGGKTDTLMQLLKANDKSGVYISKYVHNLIFDHITTDNSNNYLHTLMVKYTALGYKYFYIDDVELY